MATSESGNEHIRGECAPNRALEAVCRFVLVRFTKPRRRDKPLGEFEDLLGKLKGEDRKALQKETALDRDTKDALDRELRDPTTGPKTKDFLEQLLAAAEKGDVVSQMRVWADKENRTCGLQVQTFSLTFQKYGKGKWLNNDGPSGLCGMAKAYELSAEKDHSLWTLSEKVIAVGESTGLLCEGTEKRLNEQRVWSWKSTNEFELPCDFIQADSIMQE